MVPTCLCGPHCQTCLCAFRSTPWVEVSMSFLHMCMSHTRQQGKTVYVHPHSDPLAYECLGAICLSHQWVSIRVILLLAVCADTDGHSPLSTLYRPLCLGIFPMMAPLLSQIVQAPSLTVTEYLALLMNPTDINVWAMSGMWRTSLSRILESECLLGTWIRRSPCPMALKVSWFVALMALGAMAQ